MLLPTLYKKSAAGGLQSWTIHTEGNTIVTRWGLIGGAIQETRDVVAKGKNLGRANATTPEQQAELEAKSRWEKQLKNKKYVQSVEAAQAGERDERVQGGIDPMLAFPFDKQGHKLTYPLYGNPKLDGTRCIAIIENGKCTLWTRTRKPITSMPHIVQALEQAFSLPGTVTLDGELYAAHLNNDFEQIIHLVRQSQATDGHEAIQYWIYDLPGPGTFAERYGRLSTAFPQSPYLVLVEATLLASEDEAMEYFANCKQGGFEGAILRNADGLYVNKRSPDLIKLKSFLDDEFKIVAIEEGRGKLAGHVGAFVCETKQGGRFRVKLKGSLSTLKQHFEQPDKCIGKFLTVTYQNLTADGLPRFPVGVTIRDYE